MLPILRPTTAEIDLTKLARNVQKVRAQVGANVAVMAILKANAYGHGAVRIGEFLEQKHPVQWFGVASIEEGIRLREHGLTTPVLVLGSIYPFEAFEYALQYDLTVTIASLSAAQAVCDMAQKLGKKARCHIKQETGMGRIGMRRGSTMKVAEFLHKNPHAVLDGLYSHLSSIETDPDFTEQQIGYFRNTLTGLELKNIRVPHVHIDASSALMHRPDAHFTLVRPGHCLYGLEPGYEPVLSLKTRVVYLKDIPAGFSVSYNRSFIATQPMRVATIPLGYGDGYPRALSKKASVLIRGKRCPVLGNITMDMTMVDITGVPDACVGDEVVAVGRQGTEEVTLQELADLAGTIDYEICTQLNERVPRVYK